MFSDFALLVEEQSSMLDNIEFQIINAKVCILEGLGYCIHHFVFYRHH